MLDLSKLPSSLCQELKTVAELKTIDESCQGV